jgi:hypothetical protein
MQPNELGLTAANPKNPSPLSVFDRVWPPALLIVGAGLCAAWIAFLGYEFAGLVGFGL